MIENICWLADYQCNHPAFLNLCSQWKENFLRAMFFRGRSEEEKKNLEERAKHLEEICKRKENLLMQNKMIVKFRDSRIER